MTEWSEPFRFAIDPTTSVDETAGDTPAEFALSQNYPNPFNSETTIGYQLPEPAHVKLTIVDLLGQNVATLVNEPKRAAYYAVRWDGRNSSGNPVASGLYLYQIRAKNYKKIRKLVLSR